METGLLGYLVTERDEYLAPYSEAASTVQSNLVKTQLAAESDQQMAPAGRRLRELANEWINLSKQELEKAKLPTRYQPHFQNLERMRLLSEQIRAEFVNLIENPYKRQVEIGGRYREHQRNALTLFSILILVFAGVTALSTRQLLFRVSGDYHRALVALEEERERAEASGKLYKLITDNSVDLISIIDPDTKYQFVSQSYLAQMGFEEDEVIGHSISEFVHPEDLKAAQSRWDELVSSGSASMVVRLRHKDGSYRWIDSLAKSLDGRFLGIGRDVTEKREAENRILELNQQLEQRVTERTIELERANKELEAFSYSVSHDLRAPLRSIASFSMILQEDAGEALDADSRDNLSRIRAAAQKMTDLIDALLKFSRIARAGFHRSEVDMSQLFSAVAEDIQRAAPQRQVTFDIQQDIVAEADPQLIRVVAENLIENSWKFTGTKEDACIEFGTLEKDGEQIYFVRDNGVGFDQNYVEKAFLPFERLHTDREFPGTGIGLATVKRIVERHGGHIWAEGKLGEGAAFYFTLGVEPDVKPR